MKCNILGCKMEAIYRFIDTKTGDVLELCKKHTDEKIKQINSIEVNEIGKNEQK